MLSLFVTPWTVACQAPLCKVFPRQEYWNGLPFPPPGDFPHPVIETESLASPAFAGAGAGFFTTEPPGKPCICSNFRSQFVYRFCLHMLGMTLPWHVQPQLELLPGTCYSFCSCLPLHQPRQKPNTLPPNTFSPLPLPASRLFHLPVLQILPAAHPSSPSTSHLSPGLLQLHPAASPILSYFPLTLHLAASVIFQKCKYQDFPGGPVVKTPNSQSEGQVFHPWSGN